MKSLKSFIFLISYESIKDDVKTKEKQTVLSKIFQKLYKDFSNFRTVL